MALPNSSTVYLYFPTSRDTFPEAGSGDADWSPLRRFRSDQIPGIGNTEGLRQRTFEVVTDRFCEFDVDVVRTEDRPTPVGSRWQIIGIATDESGIRRYGEAVSRPGYAKDWGRVWVGELREEYAQSGGPLRGSSSTRGRWANAIGHTATHEAGHNFGLTHTHARPRGGEDGLTNHIMMDGDVIHAMGVTAGGELRASRVRHFSDTSYEVLAHEVGLVIKTLYNWDLVNPNITDAHAAAFTVLSEADSLTIGWSYEGPLSPWGPPTVAPTGSTREFRGRNYNEFELRFESPKVWDGGPEGVAPPGVVFHTGASFAEPDGVIVQEVDLLDASGTTLMLHPRMAGFDAGVIDFRSGGAALTVFNPSQAASPLVIEDLRISALPRQADIESMLDGTELRDIHGVPVPERALPGYEPVSYLEVRDSVSISIAHVADPRSVDITYDPASCVAEAAEDGNDEPDYCRDGTALSLFPATVLYVTVTIVDPEAQYFDPDLGQVVTGPLESRVFYQVTGTIPDSNENGMDDLLDIRSGISLDFNQNGVPDEAEPRRLGLSVHGGVATPLGHLGNSTSTGPAASLDLTYPLGPRVHGDVRGGVSRLGGQSGAPDVEIWSFAGNVKLLQPVGGGIRGFLNGGLGVYVVDSTVEGGFNVGVGVARSLSPHLYAEATFDIARTFTMPADISFGRTQLGFIWLP